MASGLPRLIVVPDHLWEAFEGVLSDCGIGLVNTDGDRSFRLTSTAADTCTDHDSEGESDD